MNAAGNSAQAGMLAQPCRQCGAKNGQWCTTAAGQPAASLHTIRFRDWHATLGVTDADVTRYTDPQVK